MDVGDGIARIHGLAGCKSTELLEFPNSVFGMAMNLDEDSVGAVILGDENSVREGDQVKTTGRMVEVPVGEGLLGRVIDPLGRPLDGKGPVASQTSRPVERVAPDVTKRKSVDTPVQTGIKAIDAMIPIGRGQRELIIGDRSIGKTAICLDTIINQKGKDLLCVYVAIGQRAGKVAQVLGILEQNGAMEHTVIVAANASDSARPAVSGPLCRLRHQRGVHGGRQGCPGHLRRPFPSTRGRTARSLCCCAARRAARPTPAMSSTCTAACWSGPPS